MGRPSGGEVHSYNWAYSKLNALGRRYLPPIICAFHNQEQVVLSLPFTAGVSEVDFPPIPGHCKIVYKWQLLAFYQCFGWHKSLCFTWLQKEEKKVKRHTMQPHQNASLFTLFRFGLQGSEELFHYHSEIKAGTKVEQTWQKVFCNNLFPSLLWKPKWPQQSSIHGSWGTNFNNKNHVTSEDKSLVALMQTARYREEVIATGK